MKRHLPFAPKSLPRICFGALIFAECIAAFASSPIPSELRKWIEDQNPNDKTPADERIFVDDMQKESAIVCYHKGMTLQDVLDQVKFREQPVVISVYRDGHEPKFEPVYEEAVTEKSKAEIFVVQPLDVIDLWNGNRN